jgi:hypothetical protein
MIDEKKYQRLISRIKNLKVSTIENMSFDVMAMLTDNFNESLVRNILYIGETNTEQRKIIKCIKNNYKSWQKDTDMFWGSLPQMEVYPKFLIELQTDIECDMVVTDKGSVPESELYPLIKVPTLGETFHKLGGLSGIAKTSAKESYAQKKRDIDAKKTKQLKEKDKTIAELKAKVKELQNELKERDENDTSKEETDTSCEEFMSMPVHQKVQLELLMKFIEKEIPDFEKKYGQKAKVASLLSIVTGLSTQICKNYVTYRNLNKETHEEEIENANRLLKALNISFQL